MFSTGYEELDRKSDVVIKRENEFALPVIRRQLNSLLGKEKKGTFSNFINHIHENALHGYKRSLIPHPSDAKGEELLTSIKQVMCYILLAVSTKDIQ